MRTERYQQRAVMAAIVSLSLVLPACFQDFDAFLGGATLTPDQRTQYESVDLSGDWVFSGTVTGGTLLSEVGNPTQSQTGTLRQTSSTTYAVTAGGSQSGVITVEGNRMVGAIPVNQGSEYESIMRLYGTASDAMWSSVSGTFAADNNSMSGNFTMYRAP